MYKIEVIYVLNRILETVKSQTGITLWEGGSIYVNDYLLYFYIRSICLTLSIFFNSDPVVIKFNISYNI